jgi:hypothetical protein
VKKNPSLVHLTIDEVFLLRDPERRRGARPFAGCMRSIHQRRTLLLSIADTFDHVTRSSTAAGEAMYEMYPEWGPARHRTEGAGERAVQRRPRYWEKQLVGAGAPADAEDRPDDN